MEYNKDAAKFYVFTENQRGKNAKQIFDALAEVWSPNSPSYATIKNWVNSFKVNESCSNEESERRGAPVTASGDDNVELVKIQIEMDPHMSVREVSGETSISETTVWRILRNSLQMHNIASFWVPKDLNAEQMAHRKIQANEIKNRLIEMGDDVYNYYAVEDEMWVRYDKEFTQSSARVWIPTSVKRPQVPANRLTPQKCLVLIAFTCNKRISILALPYGSTIKGEDYLEFLKLTNKRWSSLHSNPISFKQLVWQHDNARPHVKQCVKDYVRKSGLELLHQSPYSPDLNLCDRWLNNHVKNSIRGMQFNNASEVEQAIKNCIRNTPTELFEHELQKLITHCGKVIESNGAYVTP